MHVAAKLPHFFGGFLLTKVMSGQAHAIIYMPGKKNLSQRKNSILILVSLN